MTGFISKFRCYGLLTRTASAYAATLLIRELRAEFEVPKLVIPILAVSPSISCYNAGILLGEGSALVKRPSLKALLLGLIPYVAVCFSVPLWDRVYPMVFGMPFNFFWLTLWLLLMPVCLWGAYRVEESRSSGRRDQGGAD
jgi:hypothetical protein